MDAVPMLSPLPTLTKEKFELPNVYFNLKTERPKNGNILMDYSNVNLIPKSLKQLVSACTEHSNNCKCLDSENFTMSVGLENLARDKKICSQSNSHAEQITVPITEDGMAILENLCFENYLDKEINKAFDELSKVKDNSRGNLENKKIVNSEIPFQDLNAEINSPKCKRVKLDLKPEIPFKEGIECLDDDFDVEIKKCCEVLKCKFIGDIDLGGESIDNVIHCKTENINKMNSYNEAEKSINLPIQSKNLNIEEYIEPNFLNIVNNSNRTDLLSDTIDGTKLDMKINLEKTLSLDNTNLSALTSYIYEQSPNTEINHIVSERKNVSSNKLFIDSIVLSELNSEEDCTLIPEIGGYPGKPTLLDEEQCSSEINLLSSCVPAFDSNEDVLSILCTESDLDSSISSSDEGLEPPVCEKLQQQLVNQETTSNIQKDVQEIEESTIEEFEISFLDNVNSTVKNKNFEDGLFKHLDDGKLLNETVSVEHDTIIIYDESDVESETGKFKSLGTASSDLLQVCEEGKIKDSVKSEELEKDHLKEFEEYEELSVYEEAETASNGSIFIKSEVVIPTSSTVSSISSKDSNVDFYEKEKDDIHDPGWEAVKKLSTNEERYQQVKNCWNNKTVPNPNKNLTAHSFRKRMFQDDPVRKTKQHKRQASTDLNGHDLKRFRSCTYIFDDRIIKLHDERQKQTRELMKKKDDEVGRVNKLYSVQEARYQSQNSFDRHYRGSSYQDRVILNNLWADCARQISCITQEYEDRAERCNATFQPKLNSLNNARNEVLQFYSFYRGLNNEDRDPTVLSAEQLQELKEIDTVYSGFDKYYL